VAKPGIDELMVRSALDADLLRRLRETPDEVFEEFDLGEEEKGLLRHPDHRLLALLGRVVARKEEGVESSVEAPALVPAQTLPDFRLTVTVVPCAQMENGELKGYSYAVWVNPLPEGADPATVPFPPGATLPGVPLTPLHVVMQVSAMEVVDAAGGRHVGMSAFLRQSSNLAGPSPGTLLQERSEMLDTAVNAVHRAAPEERYSRVIDLIRALRSGDAR